MKLFLACFVLITSAYAFSLPTSGLVEGKTFELKTELNVNSESVRIVDEGFNVYYYYFSSKKQIKYKNLAKVDSYCQIKFSEYSEFKMKGLIPGEYKLWRKAGEFDLGEKSIQITIRFKDKSGKLVKIDCLDYNSKDKKYQTEIVTRNLPVVIEF